VGISRGQVSAARQLSKLRPLTSDVRARTAVANEWIALELALRHLTSVSRYCSDKFKHRDLPRFTL
jgi:hypothetical protein